jgi:hypothetical protein
MSGGLLVFYVLNRVKFKTIVDMFRQIALQKKQVVEIEFRDLLNRFFCGGLLVNYQVLFLSEGVFSR